MHRVSRTIFFAGFGGLRRLISVEGMTSVPDGASPSFYFAVTPGYFRTLGVKMVDGREFVQTDLGNVAIINEEMARRLWPGRTALGGRIRFGDDASNATWRTIVGVVSNAGGNPSPGRRPMPSAFVPFASDGRAQFCDLCEFVW
jgi:hypothetical protein